LLQWVKSYRYGLNIVLAMLAVAIEIYYSYCGGACSYLSGSLLGIELQYVGIAYMVLIVALSIAKKDHLIAVLLTVGIAIEFYLIGFQIKHDTYCYYCIAFGTIIAIMLAFNIRIKYLKTSIVLAIIALITFSIFFKGSATPQFTAMLNLAVT